MVEIFRGQVRRRWLEADKRRLVAETIGLGATVHGVPAGMGSARASFLPGASCTERVGG